MNKKDYKMLTVMIVVLIVLGIVATMACLSARM